MAPKRPSHLDEPPAASSSDDAEQVSSEEEEEDEEEDHSEDEPEETPKKAPTLASKPQASESDSESSSESEPEPDDSAVKPLASKPMEEAVTPVAKPKKPRSKAVATPAKRAAEIEPAKGSKRAKKKSSDAAAEAENNGAASASAASEDNEAKKLGGGGDEKKLFQRLWSEDDEIVILKGIIDYTAKKGSDPSADMGAFHDFIKKSLHIDVTKTQLTDKVRRLKKKYENNSAKKKYDPSKPHEKKAFELSKKIWGSGSSSGNGDEPRSNGTAVRTASRSNGKTLASLKAEILSSPEPAREAEKVGTDGSGSGLESEIFGLDKSLPEYVLRQGLGLVSEAKKSELEKKWKKLHVAELELFVQRTQLMSEQGKLILDALKSSEQ